MNFPDKTRALLAAYHDLSGKDFLERAMAEDAVPPLEALFGFRIAAVGDGMAKVSGTPQPKFFNVMQRVHGGFAAALMDTALGCAVLTKLAKGIGYGTITLNISYVKKIDEHTGLLTCEATVLHAGRTMFTAEGRVLNDRGALYAHGTGTFLVYPKD